MFFVLLCSVGAQPAAQEATWLGGTASWTSPSNWSTGAVPTAATPVVIAAGTPSQPTISSGTQNCASLLIEDGATLTLASLGDLVAGDVSFGSTPGVSTGSIALSTNNNQVTVTGLWTQDDPAAVIQPSGQFRFDGAEIAGAGPQFSSIRFEGAPTLLSVAVSVTEELEVEPGASTSGPGHIAIIAGAGTADLKAEGVVHDLRLISGTTVLGATQSQINRVSDLLVGDGAGLSLDSLYDLEVANISIEGVAGVSTGTVSMTSNQSELTVTGLWTQSAPEAVIQTNGFINFDGAEIAGSGTEIDRLRFKGAPTLLSVPVGLTAELVVDAGVSTMGPGHVAVNAGAGTAVLKAEGVVHDLRLVSGTTIIGATQPQLSRVGDLVVGDGTVLLLDSVNDLEVANVSIQGVAGVSTGTVSMTSNQSEITVTGTWTQANTDAFAQSSNAGYITFVGGQVAGVEFRASSVRVQSGVVLQVPLQVSNRLDLQAGSATTGPGWIEIAAGIGGCELLMASTDHDIRIVSGTCRPNGALVQFGDLTLLGGTLQLGWFQSGADIEVLGSIKLQGGKIAGGSSNEVIVSGVWDQSDSDPVADSNRVVFEDGSTARGSVLRLERVVFQGETTLELPMEVVSSVDFRAGSSTVASSWIEVAAGTGNCELLMASTDHDIRVVSGNCRPNGALVQFGDLTLLGGTLQLGWFQSGADIEVLGSIKLQGGKITGGSDHEVIVSGVWDQSDSDPVADSNRVVFEDGSTARGSVLRLERVVFQGETTLELPMEVVSSVDFRAGSSTVASSWIEVAAGTGNCELLMASTDHDIRVVSGTCQPNGALVQFGDLTLLGGTLRLGWFQSGADIEVLGSIKLQGGKIAGGSSNEVIVSGVWDQSDSDPVADSNRVVFEDGSTARGSVLRLERAVFQGETTLELPMEVVSSVDFRAGSSTVASSWIEVAAGIGGCELLMASTDHDIRIVSGTCRPNGALVQFGDLTLLGGTLQLGGFQSGADIEVLGSIKLQGGKISGGSSNEVIVSGTWDQQDAAPVQSTAWVRASGDALFVGAPLAIPRFRVGSGTPVLGDDFEVSAELESLAGSSLQVGGQEMLIGDPTFTVEGQLEFGPGGRMLLPDSGSMTVGPSGVLRLAGSPGLEVVVDVESGATGYGLEIDGRLEAQNAVFRGMSANGVVLGAGATLGAVPLDLRSTRFEQSLPTPPASYDLLVDNIAAAHSIVFPVFDGPEDLVNPPGSRVRNNIKRLASSTGAVNVLIATGTLTGPDNEDDSGDTVQWLNPNEVDLIATTIDAPRKGVANQPLDVAWSAQNQGGINATAPWQDQLVLTSNLVLGDGDDIELSTLAVLADLASGDTYGQMLSPVIPNGTDGSYYLAVKVDHLEQVDEPNAESNNVRFSSEPLALTSSPRPDLVSTSVTAASPVDDGSEVLVTWEVLNDGTGTAGGTWSDRIYLSADASVGGDILLGTFLQTGFLAEDDAYTAQGLVTIPAGLQGSYYLVAVTDALSEVSPEISETNNGIVADLATDVQQPFLPDLTALAGGVSPAPGVGGLFVNGSATFALTLANQDVGLDGEGFANGFWTARVYRSADANLDGADLQIGSLSNSGLLAPGATVDGAGSFSLPSSPGTHYLIVSVDTNDTIAESNEGNNVLAFSFDVLLADYEATLNCDLEEALYVPGGRQLDVPLTGVALSVPGGTPVPNVPVSIRVRHKGGWYVYTAMTGAGGDYSFVYSPIAGQAGLFELFATHPSVVPANGDPSQDSFILYGVDILPGAVSSSLADGQSTVVEGTLRNLGDVPITGLDAMLDDVPGYLSIGGLPLPSMLLPNQQVAFSLDIQATGLPPVPGETALVSLAVSVPVNGTPVVAELWPVSVMVSPALPDVLVAPGSLTLSVPRGEITTVILTLTNFGLAPALGITVDVPCIPNPGFPCPAGSLVSLIGPSNIGDLQPGESKEVELSFGPSSLFEVGTTASATIALGADNEDIADVPLNLTIVGSALGEVRVTPKDEASYYDANGDPCLANCPLVPGAAGRLYNPNVPGADYTANLVGGELWFPNTVEGTYYLEVEAPFHATFLDIVQVQGNQILELTAFLPIQSVNYSFSVEETDVDDEYEIVVEADFVVPTPAPTIRCTPNLFDLDIPVGASLEIDMSVWNDGVLIAEGLELYMDDLPDYNVTPAFTLIGDLGPNETVIVPLTIERLGTGDPCAKPVSWGLRHALTLIDDPTLPPEEWTVFAKWYWTPLFYLVSCPGVLPTGGSPPPNLPPPSDPPPSSGGSGGGGGGGSGGSGGGGSGGGPNNPVVTPPPDLEQPEPCPGN